MKKRALAKINLLLDVIGKRVDGYHDLKMVMVPIDFYDMVDIEIADELSFSSNVPYLASNNHNSIIKSIEVMRERYHFTEQFKISLSKFIPTQAGLGGGSSDSGATILIINELLKLELTNQELIVVADSIGKDVVFCLQQGSALVEGVGDKLTIIENNLNCYVLLIKPKKGISTKIAYGKLREYPAVHYDEQLLLRGLVEGDFDRVVDNLGNSFEAIAFDLVPEISKIKSELLAYGFKGVLMSGSGSCVFALSQDLLFCKQALKYFRKRYPFVWLTKMKEG